MKYSDDMQLVETIPEQCRVCYTCIRECPAKAIRVAHGQAEVIAHRCIGCGNCVRVCTQKAKRVLDSKAAFRRLLQSGRELAVCLAPSFPSEFIDIPWRRLTGMLRALGAHYVHEVAFGADLVARAYSRLSKSEDAKDSGFIATSCPAVVAYVERHHPELVSKLAPIVSPMVAMARVAKRLHGEDTAVVFVGPCVAKKGEVASQFLEGELSLALTFTELREVFQEEGLSQEAVEDSDFDEPRAASGALFPIARGMLQAAEVEENLLDGRIAVADGREDFTEALAAFSRGDLDAKLLEVLACQGCVMGPALSNDEAMFKRRKRVSDYVNGVLKERDGEQWRAWMSDLRDLDLSRGYKEEDQRFPDVDEKEVQKVLEKMGKRGEEDELNCGACGYDTCREHAVAIYLGLAEQEMCLPHNIEELKRTVKELEDSNQELATTQEALVHSEKLASMGQLAAGIAHEVNNPLGVVLMYAHLLDEDYGEKDRELSSDLKQIVEQADRCKKIVSGLLHFSRQNKVFRQKVTPKSLVEQSLKLAKPPSGIEVQLDFEHAPDTVWLDPDQIVQVLSNLIGNAYSAMGGSGGRLELSVHVDDGDTVFTVRDDGEGIAEEIKPKIFEPFFTTKQLGKGTGLGLSVAYGIVKMHGGSLTVESNADASKGDTGTSFTLRLPERGK